MLDGAQVFLSKPAGVSQQIQSSPGELWNEAWLEDEEDCMKKKRDAEKDDQNFASSMSILQRGKLNDSFPGVTCGGRVKR